MDASSQNAVTTFHSRAKDTIISSAFDYASYFLDYDYLIISDAFVKNKYYIISAIEGNYLHLTGVQTSLSAAQFFRKCISSENPLKESDFSLEKDIDSSLPEKAQKEQKKKAKGNIRRKIQALPNIKGIFHSQDTLVEEDFVKNRVHCTIAANKEIGVNKGISTIGFIKASTTSTRSVKPNTLLKEQSISPKAKPIKLALTRKKGDTEFNKIIIGDKNILKEHLDLLGDLISQDLLMP